MKLQKVFKFIAILVIVTALGFGSTPVTAQDDPPARLNYEIFIYDMHTGTTRQLTDMPGSEQYNPEFSPDGKWVVHDAWYPNDNYQELIITEVATGISHALPGGAYGNDAVWSPNGQWIAFDAWDGHIYILPPQGGEPRLVTEWGGWVNWAPNSRRLAFTSWIDGNIHTIALDGSDETIIELPIFALYPKWSPDGQWITYQSWQDGMIYKIAVNMHGDALGDPILAVPFTTWGAGKWSVNSKSLVFCSPASGEGDIYMLPVEGGEPIYMTGLEDFGDYDPAFSHDGRFITYAQAIPAP